MNDFGSQVKALRLYGSTMEYMAGVYSDIDIVVQVSELSKELLEAINWINIQLSEKYYRLLEKDNEEWSYLLDIHIINDDPREQRHPSRAYLQHIFLNDSVALN